MKARYSNLIFGASFAVALFLFGRIMAPFLMPVLLGGLLVVLFEPIRRTLNAWIPGHRALGAGVATAAVGILILLPLAVITWFVARELLAAVDSARAFFDDPDFHSRWTGQLPAFVRGSLFREGADSPMERATMSALSGSAGLISDLLGAGTELALDLFLMTVSMYYFFLDGPRIYAETARLIPLDRRYLDAFAQEFKDVAYAIVYANTVTALVQGAVGWVGLLVAGVPHSIVWAMAMVVGALVPIGGTALVWGPIAAVLFLTGRYTEATFLFGWGLLVVSTVDNFIRPKLCGSRMAMHPLLVFLSMFGGLAVFGAMGLLVGPLIAAIFMSMVRIYRRDFLEMGESPGRAQAQPEPQASSPSPTPAPAPVVVQAVPEVVRPG